MYFLLPKQYKNTRHVRSLNCSLWEEFHTASPNYNSCSRHKTAILVFFSVALKKYQCIESGFLQVKIFILKAKLLLYRFQKFLQFTFKRFEYLVNVIRSKCNALNPNPDRHAILVLSSSFFSKNFLLSVLFFRICSLQCSVLLPFLMQSKLHLVIALYLFVIH